MNINKLAIWSSVILVSGFSIYSFLGHRDEVDYSTQVKPI